MPAYIAILALQIACIAHVIRTGRNQLWIMALFFIPLASAVAYFIVEILPGMQGNRHVRNARAQIVSKLDPEREVRSARDALSLADTVANRERLADALAAAGRFDEALPLYRELVGRPGGDSAATRQKLARALFETGSTAEALTLLDAIEAPLGQSERDRSGLLRARMLSYLARKEEALTIYADLVTRMPGEEARCRYAALLIEERWDQKAMKVLAEVESRARRLDRTQRAAEADMYKWAAETLADLRARNIS